MRLAGWSRGVIAGCLPARLGAVYVSLPVLQPWLVMLEVVRPAPRRRQEPNKRRSHQKEDIAMVWSDHHGDWHVRLSNMPDPVHLLVFTRGDTPPEAGARRLGEELQAMSRNVRLELYDIDEKPLLAARYGIQQTPAFALLLGGVTIEDARIRFYGLPAGSLRRALITAIVTVGHSLACHASFEGAQGGHCGQPNQRNDHQRGRRQDGPVAGRRRGGDGRRAGRP